MMLIQSCNQNKLLFSITAKYNQNNELADDNQFYENCGKQKKKFSAKYTDEEAAFRIS